MGGSTGLFWADGVSKREPAASAAASTAEQARALMRMGAALGGQGERGPAAASRHFSQALAPRYDDGDRGGGVTTAAWDEELRTPHSQDLFFANLVRVQHSMKLHP